MNSTRPRVSIGLPVYNGEKYLAETLDSVLTQTFQDLEVIISDNGSNDGTEGIGREYALKDPRIHYYRSDVNRGVSWNFKRAVALSSGEYFMWLAHDDKLAPEFLQQCVATLDQRPEVVLAYPKAIEIDVRGKFLEKKEQTINADSPRPNERFRELIRMDHNCEALFGLTRADVLKNTSIHGDFPDSDRVVLAELTLYGTYYRVPDYLFLHREHPQRSINLYPTRFERMALIDPRKANKIAFPHWREFLEYLRGINRAPLSFRDRLACYNEMLHWLRDNRRRMKGDVLYVSKRLVRQMLHLQGRPSEAR